MAKYTLSARFYDAISAEWPIYRPGREAAIKLLHLNPGMRVLDIACGTGLNFPLLKAGIDDGLIVGLDQSPNMLRQAGRKGVKLGVHHELIEADATRISPRELLARGGGPYDAVIATYALSLMDDWESAVDTACEVTRGGGRIAITDMALPTGKAAAFAPFARLACRLGGADIEAHPWTRLEQCCEALDSLEFRGGHIQVRVGTRRSDRR